MHLAALTAILTGPDPGRIPAAPPPGGAPPPPIPLPDLRGPSLDAGSQLLHMVANTIGQWALVAAVVGIFVGGVLWAFGSYSQNYQQAYNGRKGVAVSVLAALLIGAGPHLVNFFFNQGSTAVNA